MGTIKILIIDNYSIVRDGLRVLLKQQPNYEVVGGVGCGEEAMVFLKEYPNNVNVVLIDIEVPKLNGIETTVKIIRKYPDTRVVAFTSRDEEIIIQKVMKAGAMGYVLKIESEQLTEAINKVVNGQKFYSSKVANLMISRMEDNVEFFQKGGTIRRFPLSGREIEIIEHISKGKSNKQVGIELNISSRTVETHRRNIFLKLEVKNTAELVRFAIEKQLII